MKHLPKLFCAKSTSGSWLHCCLHSASLKFRVRVSLCVNYVSTEREGGGAQLFLPGLRKIPAAKVPLWHWTLLSNPQHHTQTAAATQQNKAAVWLFGLARLNNYANKINSDYLFISHTIHNNNEQFCCSSSI